MTSIVGGPESSGFVELEVQDIPVFAHIVLALHSHLAGVFGASLPLLGVRVEVGG